MDLTLFSHATEVRFHELVQTGVRSSSLLNERDLVAKAEAILQEEGAANALESTLAHDTDSVAEDISLVHVMCGEDDDSIFFVALKHVPEVASSTKIHTGGRLI